MYSKVSQPEAIKAHIVRVLDGKAEKWSAEGEHYPAGLLIDVILDIDGLEKHGDIEMNGWQWDWWQKFLYEGNVYTLTGCGYSGGHSFVSGE